MTRSQILKSNLHATNVEFEFEFILLHNKA